jgi:carboxypeptidase C (cathepsin A)
MLKKKFWFGAVAGSLLAASGLVRAVAAQDKKQNGNKREEKVVAGTSVASANNAGDSTTEGTLTVGGQAIPYRAVAGTLTVGSSNAQDAQLSPDGKMPPDSEKTPEQATARMFYVAYFKEGGGADRPITFLYNGGPGGASLPLHMGAFGPRRVVMPDAQHKEGAPYELINNEYSLLDVSDVVFIDAPGTGFGRILGPNKEKAFWGDEQDAHAFDRFIRRFLTKYDRWNSPKYLLGESYGTTRTAMLAASLQGVDLNGVIMLSQILDFNNNADGQQYSPGSEQAYALALPTYAATAFYHHKLPSQPRALEPFLAEVEQYALGEYMSALLQGSELTDARRQAVAAKLHEYTGLPVAFLLKADLRVRGSVFTKSLLLDDEMTTGHLDARYEGPDLDPMSEAGEYDPLINAVLPAYIAGFNHYLRTELKYGDDQTYKVFASGDGNFTWDWRHESPAGLRPAEYPVGTNVMPDLAYAMKLNPKMKVMLAGGYFDVVTPFLGGMYEMHHLPIPQKLQANISYHYYLSGHMVYLNEGALKRFHSDLAVFIKGTEAGN